MGGAFQVAIEGGGGSSAATIEIDPVEKQGARYDFGSPDTAGDLEHTPEENVDTLVELLQPADEAEAA